MLVTKKFGDLQLWTKTCSNKNFTSWDAIHNNPPSLERDENISTDWCRSRPSTVNVFWKLKLSSDHFIDIFHDQLQDQLYCKNYCYKHFDITATYPRASSQKYKRWTLTVEVDATELFMVNANQTELFHWSTVDVHYYWCFHHAPSLLTKKVAFFRTMKIKTFKTKM